MERRPRESRFTALYEANYHRVLGYARRRSNAEDASDIAAETFTVAWRRLDEVPAGEGALLWLYGTARRVLANHRRAQRRRANLVDALEAESLTAATAADASEAHRVGAALGQLRDEERELLLLIAWEGLDAAGIAAVVGCSRNAARIRVHRARRRFARALAAIDGEPIRESRGPSAARGGTTANLGLEERP